MGTVAECRNNRGYFSLCMCALHFDGTGDWGCKGM